jgi:hypothetical protein
VTKEFLKAAGASIQGLPKAAGVDNFCRFLLKDSTCFHTPVHIGNSGFQNVFFD